MYPPLKSIVDAVVLGVQETGVSEAIGLDGSATTFHAKCIAQLEHILIAHGLVSEIRVDIDLYTSIVILEL